MTQDTNTASGAADLPEALRSIQRFEVVDCIDDKHVPAVIPKPHGPWVRYEDHIAALAAGQATAALAQPAPENIRGILARCRDFIDTTKAPAYPAGADLADEIDVLLAAPQPSHAAQADTQPAPVLWLSPEQFANFVDADEAPFGKYIPARKTSAGKFTIPLFAARAPAPAQSVAEQTKSADMSDEREAFEAWLRSIWSAGYGCPKFDSGKYVHHEAQRFWECWQASAAHGQAPAGATKPTEQQILEAAEKAGLWPNTVHSWIPAFHRYHKELAKAQSAPARADSVQEDAARYRLLRRGQHWSVIDGIGNDLRAEALDAAVDAARKQGANHD